MRRNPRSCAASGGGVFALVPGRARRYPLRRCPGRNDRPAPCRIPTPPSASRRPPPTRKSAPPSRS
ncbi:hypothetical protein FJM51_01330 [Amaricoccus solimangrovi]|uniref:Uncharacterized protein n=1 Tax=Amaricoccus solimangrovi TaxID=2589815 RepID=A0A501WZN8_9RHOB|nr:hypothetical protein FJM51_01330 [Amaricoccus solimangrovi]